jgi:hypothetical protein
MTLRFRQQIRDDGDGHGGDFCGLSFFSLPTREKKCRDAFRADCCVKILILSQFFTVK